MELGAGGKPTDRQGHCSSSSRLAVNITGFGEAIMETKGFKRFTRNEENVIDGQYHDTSGLDLEDLVRQIESRLGSRKNYLRKDPDAYQDFWLGVMESIPKATKTADPVPYLINKGYGRAWQNRRSESRHSHVSYCKKCDQYHTFTRLACPECGSELEYLNRRDFIDQGHFLPTSKDEDVTLRLTIEQFIEQLDGKMRYVAKRWMLDRADLMYDNYCKQLSAEVGIGASGIAKIVKKIRRAFQVWYNE